MPIFVAFKQEWTIFFPIPKAGFKRMKMSSEAVSGLNFRNKFADKINQRALEVKRYLPESRSDPVVFAQEGKRLQKQAITILSKDLPCFLTLATN